MRLRKVKDADLKLKNSKYFVESPESYKGKWKSLFKNDNPIHIEVGCGKGKFILELAKTNPDINYIAIEKYDSVLLRVSEKLEELEYDNLKITILDAKEISNFFISFSSNKGKHFTHFLASKRYIGPLGAHFSSNSVVILNGYFSKSLCKSRLILDNLNPFSLNDSNENSNNPLLSVF